MRIITVTICAANVCALMMISSAVQAQSCSMPPAFTEQDFERNMVNYCMCMHSADYQQCSCWWHTALSMLSSDDLQSLLQRHQETPGSIRAAQMAEQRCGFR
ncbi:MAG: hypothetical protein JO038_02670 [Alphaproteobacteria bacterium]|nr:hypothetical protein [Alphaproteobacteria bacterium]